jgi:hypothetical protein
MRFSVGERRLGAWEAVPFGAAHVESALAVRCHALATECVSCSDRDVRGHGTSARNGADNAPCVYCELLAPSLGGASVHSC